MNEHTVELLSANLLCVVLIKFLIVDNDLIVSCLEGPPNGLITERFVVHVSKTQGLNPWASHCGCLLLELEVTRQPFHLTVMRIFVLIVRED